MAEEEEKGTLDKLVGVVQNYKQQDSKGSGGWIAAAIAGIVALISIALLAFNAWKKGKETARLLHEKAVEEEKERQATEDAIIAETREKQDEAAARAMEHLAEVTRLAEEAGQVEAERRRAHELIDQITSWEDIDELVR